MIEIENENTGKFNGINNMSEPTSPDLIGKPIAGSHLEDVSSAAGENGHTNGEGKKLTPEQVEAIRKNAEEINRMAVQHGTTATEIEEKLRHARAGASYINGDRSSKEQIIAKLSRYLTEESKTTNLKNGKDTNSENSGVHTENKTRDQIDPKLH